MNRFWQAGVTVFSGVVIGLAFGTPPVATTAPATTPTTTATAPDLTLKTTNPNLPKTVYTEVYLRENGQVVKGHLLEFTADELVVHNGKDLQRLQWKNLTGSSAFTLRSRLIDKTNPQEWLALGKFGWDMNAKEQATGALNRAVALDASLRPAVQDVLKSEAGVLIKPPAPTPVTPVADVNPIKDTTKKNTKPGKEGKPGELFPELR